MPPGVHSRTKGFGASTQYVLEGPSLLALHTTVVARETPNDEVRGAGQGIISGSDHKSGDNWFHGPQIK